ncbi:MAG: pyridoxal-phosphate dependent enzyme [Deltaproteobacteria bacterium]|nr:MAG: pyridoxal-phosphate dependent enzyme [Deltaproteobacteria bacterium]
MADEEPALFRAFPDLRARLPHRPFLSGPTRVEPLELGAAAGAELYVKRDDTSCALYGGNKPRKLEFVLGRAAARGARRLVTTGALGTHHGLATTILGRALGLRTTLVLVSQPVTPHVRETLALQAAYGAELVYGAHVAGTAAQVLRVLAASQLRGERPYRVPTGGSSALGNLGFVSAALELAEQVRAGLLPEPARIFVPVGTGGTQVGLVLGLRMAGLRSRVVGVLVTDILPPSPRRLARAARRALRLLRRADPRVPRVDVAPADFALVRNQLGAGYGAPTPAARAAVEAAARCGLALETTYTGKSLAAILAELASGGLREQPVLFWNTHNSLDVARLAPSAPRVEALPARFRRLLRESGDVD